MAAGSGGWSWGAASWGAKVESDTVVPEQNEQGWSTKSPRGASEGTSGSNTVSSGVWDQNQSPWKPAGGSSWASQTTRTWGSAPWGTSGAQGGSEWWKRSAGNSSGWSSQAWASPFKGGDESLATKGPEEISDPLCVDVQKPKEDVWNNRVSSSAPPGEQEFTQQSGGSPQPNEKPQQQPKSYHQDEWYQKWLKRQNNDPTQEPEIAPEKPPELDSEKKDEAVEAGIATVPSCEALPQAKLDSKPEEAALVAQPAAASELDERPQTPAEQPTNGLPDSELLSDAQSPPMQEEQQGKQPEQTKLDPTTEQSKAEATAPEAVPATAETEMQQTEASSGSRKEYENEEWYQKWLRRQQNKNRQIIDIGKPQEPAPIDETSDEKRVCPDDGKTYTFKELMAAYSKEYGADDLKAYWRTCRKEGEKAEEPPKQEEKEHPHQHEEWYQKWLRRQQNKNRQIIEIGKPAEPPVIDEDSPEKRLCPDDGKKYNFQELKVAYGSSYKSDDLKAYWRDAMKEISGDLKDTTVAEAAPTAADEKELVPVSQLDDRTAAAADEVPVAHGVSQMDAAPAPVALEHNSAAPAMHLEVGHDVETADSWNQASNKAETGDSWKEASNSGGHGGWWNSSSEWNGSAR